MKIENIGEPISMVVCDFCNADGDTYTMENDEVMHTNYGGVIIGSYAVCGHCVKKNDYLLADADAEDGVTLNMAKFQDDEGNDEDVSDVYVLPQDQTFGDNVRTWRVIEHGTSSCQMKFISFDDSDEMFNFLNKPTEKGGLK